MTEKQFHDFMKLGRSFVSSLRNNEIHNPNTKSSISIITELTNRNRKTIYSNVGRLICMIGKSEEKILEGHH